MHKHLLCESKKNEENRFGYYTLKSTYRVRARRMNEDKSFGYYIYILKVVECH
jgi:hypothetical protein